MVFWNHDFGGTMQDLIERLQHARELTLQLLERL